MCIRDRLLNNADIPAACFHVDTFPEYLNMLKTCTDITGNEEAYQKNGAEVKARIDKMLDELNGKPDKKDILFIRAGSVSYTHLIMVINQRFFVSGFKSLWHRAPNMDTLVALGAGAAFVYSTYALFAMTGAQLNGDMDAVMRYMLSLIHI